MCNAQARAASVQAQLRVQGAALQEALNEMGPQQAGCADGHVRKVRFGNNMNGYDVLLWCGKRPCCN